MGPRGIELAAAELDVGSDDEQRVREARGEAAERGGAEVVGLVPVADPEQRLDLVRDEQGAVDAVPAQRLEPRLPQPRRFPWPSQHDQHVGEVDVRPVQAPVVADLFGELHGVAKMGQALLGAAEVDQVAAEHGERPDLCLAGADIPRERERLLADRQRLLVALDQHQPRRE
jgi:hypothetical protein